MFTRIVFAQFANSGSAPGRLDLFTECGCKSY